MLPPFDAILFDFDGTLAMLNLDFPAMRRQVMACALAHRVPAPSLHSLDILEIIAHTTDLLAQQHQEQAAAFTQEVNALLQAIEVEAAYQSGLLPGVQELLAALRDCRIGVGIVTRNCDAAVRVMFPDIDTYCQAFIPRERVTRVKPHPAHLQAALDQLAAAPSGTLMVGDGAMDMQAGKALGMFTIGVLSGSGTRASLLAQGADIVLDSATEILPYLPPDKELEP